LSRGGDTAKKMYHGEGCCHSQEKRPNETSHKQGGDSGKGQGETVEKRKCPFSEESGSVDGGAGAGVRGGSVKKG
jgi:hypothetical protein